jgi:hypothetical protein
MKNKLLGIALVLSLAALVFVLIGCPISNGKYGITIRPKQGGYPKLEAKWTDIQSVLNDYPYLYYIEEFRDGDHVGGPRGTSCNLFPLANLEQVKKAKETVPPYGSRGPNWHWFVNAVWETGEARTIVLEMKR